MGRCKGVKTVNENKSEEKTIYQDPLLQHLVEGDHSIIISRINYKVTPIVKTTDRQS